jgi:hypothetical protein
MKKIMILLLVLVMFSSIAFGVEDDVILTNSVSCSVYDGVGNWEEHSFALQLNDLGQWVTYSNSLQTHYDCDTNSKFTTVDKAYNIKGPFELTTTSISNGASVFSVHFTKEPTLVNVQSFDITPDMNKGEILQPTQRWARITTNPNTDMRIGTLEGDFRVQGAGSFWIGSRSENRNEESRIPITMQGEDLVLTKMGDGEILEINNHYILNLQRADTVTADGRFVYVNTAEESTVGERVISVYEGEDRDQKSTYTIETGDRVAIALKSKFGIDELPENNPGVNLQDFTITAMEDDDASGLAVNIIPDTQVSHDFKMNKGDILTFSSLNKEKGKETYVGNLEINEDVDGFLVAVCGKTFQKEEPNNALGKGSRIDFSSNIGICSTSCLFNSNEEYTGEKVNLHCNNNYYAQMELPFEGLEFTREKLGEEYVFNSGEWTCDDRSCTNSIAFVLDPTNTWNKVVQNVKGFESMSTTGTNEEYFELHAKSFEIDQNKYFKLNNNPVFLKIGSLEIFAKEMAIGSGSIFSRRSIYLEPVTSSQKILPGTTEEYTFSVKLDDDKQPEYINCCSNPREELINTGTNRLNLNELTTFGCSPANSRSKHKEDTGLLKYTPQTNQEGQCAIRSTTLPKDSLRPSLESEPSQVEETDKGEMTIIDETGEVRSLSEEKAEKSLREALDKGDSSSTCGKNEETFGLSCACNKADLNNPEYKIVRNQCFGSENDLYCCDKNLLEIDDEPSQLEKQTFVCQGCTYRLDSEYKYYGLESEGEKYAYLSINSVQGLTPLSSRFKGNELQEACPELESKLDCSESTFLSRIDQTNDEPSIDQAIIDLDLEEEDRESIDDIDDREFREQQQKEEQEREEEERKEEEEERKEEERIAQENQEFIETHNQCEIGTYSCAQSANIQTGKKTNYVTYCNSMAGVGVSNKYDKCTATEICQEDRSGTAECVKTHATEYIYCNDAQLSQYDSYLVYSKDPTNKVNVEKCEKSKDDSIGPQEICSNDNGGIECTCEVVPAKFLGFFPSYYECTYPLR